jgi:transcriptional regulator with XRE-family HTH domain
VETVDTATVGRQVRRRRRAAGLSQAELAERAGVSRQAVGALEAGRHLPRVDAAMALAVALGTTVEDLLAPGTGRDTPVHVLDGRLREGQPVRAARVADHTVCVPLPAVADGEVWAAPDAVLRDGRLAPLPGSDLDAFVVAGCDPALGLLAALAPPRGAGRLLPVVASSAAARLALTTGRVHAAVVHDTAPPDPDDADRVHRITLAAWRTGLAVAPSATGELAQALGGRGQVVQRDPGAAAQAAYERALAARGVRARPAGPLASGHVDAARRALESGLAAVTIEPVALALGLGFRALETHVVEVWIDAAAVDHPGARALGEVLTSARLRDRLASFAGYELAGAA